MSVTLGCLAVAACGGSAQPTPLPADGSAAVPATSGPLPTSSPSSPRAEVLASYLRFWDVVVAVHRAGDPASPGLAAVATDPQLSRVRDTVSRNRIQKLSLRGPVTHRARVATVSAAAATVEDCYDISRWNPVDLRTGKAVKVIEQGGTGRYRARYSLRRSAGAWLVADQSSLGGC